MSTPDQQMLSYRLTSAATRVARLENEVALLAHGLDAWWSGPAAARLLDELGRRCAQLGAVRRSLGAAAVRSA